MLAPLAQDVVIAGLDRDYVAALLIPDLNACATLLGSSRTPDPADVAADARLVAVGARTPCRAFPREPGEHAMRAPRFVAAHAAVAGSGEITDKGSINQRAILEHHAELVARLYENPAGPFVADIGGESSP